MADELSLKQWGNSLGIRIPKVILEASHISIDDTLSITVEDGAIVIRKALKHKTFDERLAEYNGRISKADFTWDEPVGREIF